MESHNKDGKHLVNPANWVDIGCDDLKRAAESRQRVAEGYAHEWWDWLKQRLRTIPLDAALPPDIPIGEMPTVGRGRGHTNDNLEET